MTDVVEEQLKTLQSSIVNRPPVCFGTLPISAGQCELFYGKRGSVQRLNFATATEDELKSLSAICDRATFGVNQEDVLDESYRKAGKLDESHFSMKFNALEAGLLDVVSTELFEGMGATRPIRAELYKLNVYEEGSFFKSHVDTPREENMFGSLVITFPTKHEGGALTFRHEGGEWTVDSGRLISEKVAPCVVYTAFYSDVEHEVLPVTSGSRVTVTYNLYFVPQDAPFVRPVGDPIPAHRSGLESAFRALLDDPTFLPAGGRLGFGLHHQYPLDTSRGKTRKTRKRKHTGDDEQKRAQLNALQKFLKGGDAALKQLCDDLKLKNFLRVVYRGFEGYKKEAVDILCKQVVSFDDETVEGSLVAHLRYDYGAKLLTDTRFEKRDLKVAWVTHAPRVNFVKQQYMAYGNEAEMTHAYFRVCLFVKVGAAGSRETIDDDSDGDEENDANEEEEGEEVVEAEDDSTEGDEGEQ